MPDPGAVADGPTTATWRQFEEAAPDLAAGVRARFGASPHHVLATIRRSGAPRLSGTEVRIDAGHLSVGMMPDSHKLADVRRDPRVEVHTAPVDHELAHGDAKVAGRLAEVTAAEAGYGDDAPGDGTFFALAIERVSLVRVDGDELVFATWSPRDGLREARRR